MTSQQRPELETHCLVDDDGYTLTRFIKGEPRMYSDARFSFRPIKPLDIAKLYDRKQGLDNEQLLLAHAKSAAARITEWNLRDAKGKPLPVKEEAFLKIHPLLAARLFNVVLYGTSGGDLDPQEDRIREQLRDIPNLLDDDEVAMGTVDREQKNLV